MFTLNIARRPYRVDFKHANILDCPATHCIIANHRFSALGTSVCNGINISKNKRRKIAFKNALKMGGFTRNERARFWYQYFASRGVIS